MALKLILVFSIVLISVLIESVQPQLNNQPDNNSLRQLMREKRSHRRGFQADKTTFTRNLRKNQRNRTCALNITTHKYEALTVPSGKKLELLHLVFRHGARTPADTYPNDPYLNYTFAPFGWGQVTNIGKCNLYDTGDWLRKRYDSFLGPEYFPDLVHAQATGVSRTHMSLQTVLAGLFKPKGTSMEWNKKLNWQPIPIMSEELDKDTLLLVRISCPRYGENFEEVSKYPEYQELVEKSSELYEKLSNITGQSIKSPEDVSSLYSTLKAEEEFGLALPEVIKQYYPDQMQENAELAYNFNIYTKEMQRIKSGPFIKKMTNEWKAKKDDKLSPAKRKLYIYCGHDSTIVNILYALGVWNTQFPGYAVMAMFELYSTDDGQYEIKVYQKNEGEEPTPLTLPGCSEYCPLDKFLELAAPLIPSDSLTEECKPKNPDYVPPPLGGP